MKRLARLIDLSDEIRLMTFEELNNVEMLNSLMDISTRLDQILCDTIFTTHLTLIRSSSNDCFHSLGVSVHQENRYLSTLNEVLDKARMM